MGWTESLCWKQDEDLAKKYTQFPGEGKAPVRQMSATSHTNERSPTDSAMTELRSWRQEHILNFLAIKRDTVLEKFCLLLLATESDRHCSTPQGLKLNSLFNLEGTGKDHTLANCLITSGLTKSWNLLLEALCKCLLHTDRHGALGTSPGILFWGLTPLCSKEMLPSAQLEPFPRVQSLDLGSRSPAPLSLLPQEPSESNEVASFPQAACSLQSAPVASTALPCRGNKLNDHKKAKLP